jgi:hypothetical protein
LAEALKECLSLAYLNLNGNKIKTNGAMMVTELLFTHDKLLSLNLGNNKIDHDGIIGILSVLNSSNYTLEELNLENPVYKTICQSVAIHFGKMFQNNVGLQKISMRKHQLRDEGLYIIMEHLTVKIKPYFLYYIAKVHLEEMQNAILMQNVDHLLQLHYNHLMLKVHHVQI